MVKGDIMASNQQNKETYARVPPVSNTSYDQAAPTKTFNNKTFNCECFRHVCVQQSSLDAKKPNLGVLMPGKVTLDTLTARKNKDSVVVRILRMWEARNFNLNGALMSLDLLFLDEEDTLIQGSIYYRRIC